MANPGRRRLLQAAGFGAVGVGLGAAGLTFASASRAAPLSVIARGRQWFNTVPLSANAFARKVTLVNFWTYSCINSLRALPYLREWADKYRDSGLIVLGVHAPEFQFEHDATRVAKALVDQGVTYPNVLDNDYAIWTAFNNEAWPGFFIVDGQSHIWHTAFGEGVYAELERVMQALFAEAGRSANVSLSRLVGDGVQAQADWGDLQSPETYAGYAKAERLVSLNGLRHDAPAQYQASAALSLNQWSFGGAWTVGAEFASPAGAGSSMRYRFHARDLHLVMGREPGARPVRYRISVDSAAPGADHGVDTAADGAGLIEDDRMYQLVRQSGAIGSRTFEIEFLDPGARIYVFTFG
jgi:thiol-disulfide isomerase/thioredoxin